MRQRLFLLMTVLLFSAVFLVSSANAQGNYTDVYPVEGGNLYFNADTGAVVGCDDTVTAAVIPAKIAGVTVTTIGDSAFADCGQLTEVVLPDTLTFIDECAFIRCTALKEIALPDSLHTLSYAAFRACTALERIEIPDSVTTMGYSVFAYCTGLKEVKFSSGMTQIPRSSFFGCSALVQVEIPSSVTKICREAFQQCGGLKELTIPDSVIEIEEKAFLSASSLEKLSLSKNLQILGDNAFDRATSLKELTLPAGITSMGKYCFRGCAIRELTVPGTVLLGQAAFSQCQELEKLVLEEGITYVPGGAFDHSTKLKELHLPDSLESIRGMAFSHTGLETLIIPSKVKMIEVNAFVNSEKLLSVGFLGDCPTIQAYAFDLNRNEQNYSNPNLRFYRLENAQGWEHFETFLWDGENLPVIYPDSYTVLDFTDVSRNAWYAEAVEYAVEAGLMNGTSSTTFAPEENMTRAMLVTVLWRYAGSPEVGLNTFSDVPEGTWYTQAVTWAAEEGVVNGVGDSRFDPEGNVTREQMATILYRYSNSTGTDTSDRGDLSAFPDASNISAYATDALSWAVAEGLINGTQNGGTVTLAPKGNATRAQVAAILMRYIEAKND